MRITRNLMLAVASLGLVVPAVSVTAAPNNPTRPPQPTDGRLLASGLQGTVGATIGPDGALYVAEGRIGKITRIDPSSGKTTTFFSGLPPAVLPPEALRIGGAVDVAFIGTTAYALVTLVTSELGGTGVNGIYRLNGDGSYTIVADLGAFSAANLPPVYDLTTGLQFALQPIAGGFLVSDGHHNRVLRVTIAGDVGTPTQLIQLGNVVPTGLAVSHGTVFVSEVGPVPYLPAGGKVVSFGLADPAPSAVDVASGFSAIVDVEFGPDGVLYALSQGDSPSGVVNPADPAAPNSGKLLRVNDDGTFSVLVDELNLPSSLDFVGDTAFVVTLNGEVWKIKNVSKLGSHRH